MRIVQTIVFALSLAAAGCSSSHRGEHECNHAGCDCNREGHGGEAPAGGGAAEAAPEAAEEVAAQPTE